MPAFGVETEASENIEPKSDVTLPSGVLNVTPETPLVPEQGNYDSVIRDNHYHNLRDFFNHMEGTTYTVQFYHQLLGAADTPELFSVDNTTHSSQLRKIKNLQIKLQGDFSFSKDPDTDVVTISGEANVFPGFTPNKFDVFIGDAGEGRQYLFNVTSSVELSARRDRATRITFEVMEVLLDSTRETLNSLVTDTQVFTKDFVSEYGYLSEAKLPTLIGLKELAITGWGYYYDIFYSPAQNNFLLEKDDGRTLYDKWLSKFLKAFEPNLSPYANKSISHFDIGDGGESINTIWDLLLDGNRTKIGFLNKEFNIHEPCEIPVSYDRDSISFSQISEFIYPVDENNTLLSEDRVNRRQLIANRSEPLELPSQTPSEALGEVLGNNLSNHKLPSDDYYYVLSAAFYQSSPTNYSLLEYLVSNYLDGKQTDPVLLTKEFNRVLEHEEDEVLFYHLPILLLLTRTIVNSDFV